MKRIYWLLCALLLSIPITGQGGINDTIEHFNPQHNLSFSAERGDKLWHQKNTGKDGKERDCTLCHGTDLKKSGKHIKTKWTFGRECTNQEKGDLLMYLSQF